MPCRVRLSADSVRSLRPAPSGTAAGHHRLAWLDALRAIAACLVVYEHMSFLYFHRAWDATNHWLLPGRAGVFLFFLVSGYIIPASLERHGSLRAFWVSRVCRLYPLYLAVAVLVAGLGLTGLVPLDPYLAAHPATTVLAHASMLPQLLGVPLITDVFWTLTFEMAFYLLVGGLFAVRLHQASGVVAVILAGLSVAIVPLTPKLLAGAPVDVRNITVASVLLLLLGLLTVASGRRRLVVPAVVMLAVLAGTLLLFKDDP